MTSPRPVPCRLAIVVALLFGLGGLAGCSSSNKQTPTGSGPIRVFAAASLAAPFNAARAALATSHPGWAISFNLAGSNVLVSQIMQGAPADVIATADSKNMQTLVDAHLVDKPVTFATNKLKIAVAAGNPKHITGLADLAHRGISTVLEAPGVPAGDYTRQVLTAQHIALTPKSLEVDVKAALAKVTSGEADAAVVYVTDVTAAGPKVSGVAVPDSQQPVIAYPIAVVKSTKNPAVARAFVQSAVSGEVQRAVEAGGFLPPK